MKVEIGSLDRHGSRAIRRDFAHGGALKLPVIDEGISIDGRSYSVASRVFQYLRGVDGILVGSNLALAPDLTHACIVQCGVLELTIEVVSAVWREGRSQVDGGA